MTELFKKMTKEELRQYMDEHQNDEMGELAFIEYSSRIDWKTPPKFNSPAEEERFIANLIEEKTQNK